MLFRVEYMEVHVWELVELTLKGETRITNPYMDVDLWIDLDGPGFSKRIYGFWDGDTVYRIRFVATCEGEWRWLSKSNQDDPGLNGKSGSFTALAWTEQEKLANPCRRGFIRNTANKRAFKYADGTPYYLLADTWWAAPTFRFPWNDDDDPRSWGRELGFKDMVKFRKQQGYNCIGMIAALPHWDKDGFPATIQERYDGELISVREAWEKAGEGTAKDMHNEGGRPFTFPGKVPGLEDIVPDFEKVNPAYFQHMDKKVSYLNSQGFTVFIESVRRDVSTVWRRYYPWPKTFSRFLFYLFARYQAHNCLFSPIHYDYFGHSIPAKDYLEPIHHWLDQYGMPPFGTPMSNNASPSTLVNFGSPEDARWLTFHQIGNFRDHSNYRYLTDIYNDKSPLPALNGEPYYPGYPDDNPPANTELAERNCRSGMYGSFLCGGFAGYFYGCEGIWGGDIEDDARYRIWEALTFESGAQVSHFKKFVFAQGERYQDLIPRHDWVLPGEAGEVFGYEGWAFCAATSERDFLLLYFEAKAPQAIIRNLDPEQVYDLRWFNPRKGVWIEDGSTPRISPQQDGRALLPPTPDGSDWGLSIVVL